MAESQFDALKREAERARQERVAADEARRAEAERLRSRLRERSEAAVAAARSLLDRAQGLEPRLREIMASGEWAHLLGIDAQVHGGGKKQKRWLTLPELYVDEERARARFKDEPGETYRWRRHVWWIGPDLRLRCRDRHAYSTLEWEVARFRRLGELPSLRLAREATKPPQKTVLVTKGASLALGATEEEWSERAALALCAARLLELVEGRGLVEALARVLRAEVERWRGSSR